MACVPTAKLGMLIVAEPPEIAVAVPNRTVPSKSCTEPVGAFPVDVTFAVKDTVPCGTFVLATVIFVVVGAAPVVVDPPPQPSVKVSTQINPRARAVRYRFVPGRRRSRTAAKPVIALNPHRPLLPGLEIVNVGANPAHRNFCSAGSSEALVEEDGAATASVRFPVAGLVLITLTATDAGEQVTPGGKVVELQLTLTVPVKPPLGVTVTVEGAVLPAATAVVAAEMLKEALLVTAKVIGAAVVEVA